MNVSVKEKLIKRGQNKRRRNTEKFSINTCVFYLISVCVSIVEKLKASKINSTQQIAECVPHTHTKVYWVQDNCQQKKNFN